MAAPSALPFPAPGGPVHESLTVFVRGLRLEAGIGVYDHEQGRQAEDGGDDRGGLGDHLLNVLLLADLLFFLDVHVLFDVHVLLDVHIGLDVDIATVLDTDIDVAIVVGTCRRIRLAAAAAGREVGDVGRGPGGLRLVLIGGAIGLALAAVAGRLVSGLLFVVSSFDLMAFLAVAVILGAAATLAAWLPARRAARISPALALRAE